MKLSDRNTGDILVLMIAGTICSSVLLAGLGLAILKFKNPEADTLQALNAVTDVINTMIGLLAGFLAGRTEMASKDPGDKDDTLDNK